MWAHCQARLETGETHSGIYGCAYLIWPNAKLFIRGHWRVQWRQSSKILLSMETGQCSVTMAQLKMVEPRVHLIGQLDQFRWVPGWAGSQPCEYGNGKLDVVLGWAAGWDCWLHSSAIPFCLLLPPTSSCSLLMTWHPANTSHCGVAAGRCIIRLASCSLRPVPHHHLHMSSQAPLSQLPLCHSPSACSPPSPPLPMLVLSWTHTLAHSCSLLGLLLLHAPQLPALTLPHACTFPHPCSCACALC